MRRTLFASLALLIAGSVAAATEQAAQTTTTASDKPAQTVTTADSPMVAAAKKSSRAKSKRVVITNESLKNSTGHITTTKVQVQKNIEVPAPKPTDEMLWKEKQQKEKKEAADKAKRDAKAAEAKKQKLDRMSAAAEESALYGEGDPAANEHMLEQASQTPDEAPAAPERPKPHAVDDERPQPQPATTTATDAKPQEPKKP